MRRVIWNARVIQDSWSLILKLASTSRAKKGRQVPRQLTFRTLRCGSSDQLWLEMRIRSFIISTDNGTGEYVIGERVEMNQFQNVESVVYNVG